MPVSLGALEIESRPAGDEECQALGIIPEQHVISISRVILAKDRPLAYLIDILPVDMLTPEEINGAFTGSVLDLLLSCLKSYNKSCPDVLPSKLLFLVCDFFLVNNKLKSSWEFLRGILAFLSFKTSDGSGSAPVDRESFLASTGVVALSSSIFFSEDGLSGLSSCKEARFGIALNEEGSLLLIPTDLDIFFRSAL